MVVVAVRGSQPIRTELEVHQLEDQGQIFYLMHLICLRIGKYEDNEVKVECIVIE